MAQIDDEFIASITRQSQEKPRGPTAIRKARYAGPGPGPCVSRLFAAVGCDGWCSGEAKPAEFPLLRKVPLTSAVSKILDL